MKLLCCNDVEQILNLKLLKGFSKKLHVRRLISIYLSICLFIYLAIHLPIHYYNVRTSQESSYVSATRTNRIMLFREKSVFIVRTI
jgi:hypothetical protein